MMSNVLNELWMTYSTALNQIPDTRYTQLLSARMLIICLAITLMFSVSLYESVLLTKLLQRQRPPVINTIDTLTAAVTSGDHKLIIYGYYDYEFLLRSNEARYIALRNALVHNPPIYVHTVEEIYTNIRDNNAIYITKDQAELMKISHNVCF
jgi:hypothetical protein